MKELIKFIISIILDILFPSRKNVNTNVYEKDDPDNATTAPSILSADGKTKINFSAKKYDDLKKQSPHYRKEDY